MNSDILNYRASMGVVCNRLASVEQYLDRSEVQHVFGQLERALMEIAFSSLAGNSDHNTKARVEYGNHNSVKRLFEYLQQVNPDFYPVPLERSSAAERDFAQYEIRADGFLTKDEFVVLHGMCYGELGWSSPESIPYQDSPYSLEQWVARIKRLLWCHRTRHVDHSEHWYVILQDPRDGLTHVFPTQPTVR